MEIRRLVDLQAQYQDALRWIEDLGVSPAPRWLENVQLLDVLGGLRNKPTAERLRHADRLFRSLHAAWRRRR